MPERNIEFIRAFIRNLEELPNSSNDAANRLASILEEKVLARVSQGNFTGGILSSYSYSNHPIKAYKLGNAIVTGSGMGGRQLSINGITIDNQDWYWGEKDREEKGVSITSTGRPTIPFGDSTPKPVPVFIPGYRGWSVRYNGNSSVVNLSFDGSMLENFYVDTKRTRGTNQYGGHWEMRFEVEEPFRNEGIYTDLYRNWLEITEEELDEAIEESNVSLASLLGIRR